MPTLRLLPHGVAPGPWNMAADEALLAAATLGQASLRFYEWTEATLSLGYFQPARAARAYPGLGDLAWVRRPSGGAAIVHHREVTYALALPPGRTWQPPGVSWLCRMHDVLRLALARLGVEARQCGSEWKRGEVLCFLHHTSGDLFIGECKVAGSAQRKQRGALMQHGSILLAQSPHTPDLPGIAELSGRALSPADVSSALVASLADATGFSVEPGPWTAHDEQVIAELVGARYATAAWNERR
jgi:lipoate-protein ligase A